ncbi:hypothetical protein ZHAS_00007975 [Anopheles sinensis]|uniref:Uncharacterized protein n=1 Tax=Anopheles sinensis TaxID=74873 RepID=A0A084VR93_ANOSI|nr:hypothetical protein ZHAS_00007975 [Anopheles sinensis]
MLVLRRSRASGVVCPARPRTVSAIISKAVLDLGVPRCTDDYGTFLHHSSDLKVPLLFDGGEANVPTWRYRNYLLLAHRIVTTTWLRLICAATKKDSTVRRNVLPLTQ